MKYTRRTEAEELLRRVALEVEMRQRDMLTDLAKRHGLRCRHCRITALEILADCGWARAADFVTRQRPH